MNCFDPQDEVIHVVKLRDDYFVKTWCQPLLWCFIGPDKARPDHAVLTERPSNCLECLARC